MISVFVLLSISCSERVQRFVISFDIPNARLILANLYHMAGNWEIRTVSLETIHEGIPMIEIEIGLLFEALAIRHGLVPF